MNSFICKINIIFILIIILLPNTTNAEDTTTAAEERWFYIQDTLVNLKGNRNKAKVYLDTDTIQYKEEILSFWLKSIFEKPQVMYSEDKKTKLGVVKYSMQLIKISCANRETSRIEFILLDENKNALYSKTSNLDMQPIPPESLSESLYIALCNLYK